MATESAETPLEAEVVLVSVFILHKILIFLVHRVICQMHELVVFVDLASIDFAGETGESLLEHIDPQRFVAGNEYVYSEVKFVSVNQQRVRNISRYDAQLINVHLVDIVDDMDALALTRVSRFDYPHVFLTLATLLESLEMRVEIAEFIRNNISIRGEVKRLAAVTFLHAYHVCAEAVLPCDLLTLRKVVDLLKLIESFIKVALATGSGPEDVPFMGFSVGEAIGF